MILNIFKTLKELNLKYRPEIDGLRSIAVMPVIFFHADFTIFSGGYVGVDIFFVISGYLITSIIISELEQGQFYVIGGLRQEAD
jgi:peptidoglycan/LPS O-acetylase OafA/YrhL